MEGRYINSKGFSLVELLIVLLIITVVVILVSIFFNPIDFLADILKQSRDTRRISDLQAIDSALSVYRQDVGSLFKSPTSATVATVIGLIRQGQDCTGYSNCFTSLAAWQAAFGGINFGACAQGDLVCANTNAVAQIDGSWTNPDTSPVTIQGWVTDVNHYVKIYTTASARHQGKWDTTKYRLSGTYNYDAGAMLNIYQGYTKVEGIQIGRSGGTDTMDIVFLARNDIELSKSIVKNDGASGITRGIFVRDTASNFKIWNTLVYDVQSYGISVGAGGFIYNTTIVNPGTYGISVSLTGGSNLTLKNVLAKGAATRDFYKTGAGSMSCYNCASGDATANDYGGSNNRVSQTFTFVNEAAKDFHLSTSDTGAKGFGVNIYLTDSNLSFQDDIDGDPRGTTWDIGSDQVTSGSFLPAAQEVVGLVRYDCAGYQNCFNSLAAWQAAFGGINFASSSCVVGDLICVNKIAVAQIDGTWSQADTSPVVIQGWVTDSRRYAKIYTTLAARHQGKWDTTKYRLNANANWVHVLDIEQPYTKVDGLQISRLSGSGNRAVVYFNKPGIQLSNSIIKKEGGDPTGGIWLFNGADNFKIWNSLIYDVDNGGISGYNTGYIYNVTIINAGAQGIYANADGSTNWTLKNVLVKGSTFQDFYKLPGNGSMICYNCASGDATANQYGGTGNMINQTFTFVNEAAKDFHLSTSDTGAKGLGTDLSLDPYLSFSNDIDGDLRFKSWDIGADQASSAASIVFISLPDVSKNCPSYSLPSLPNGWSYYCTDQNNFQKVNGNGWIPVDFTKIPANAFPALPIDPTNQTDNGKYYTFVSDGKKWELTSILESDKNKGVDKIGGKDGGQNVNILEVGTNLTLTPSTVKSRNQ